MTRVRFLLGALVVLFALALVAWTIHSGPSRQSRSSRTNMDAKPSPQLSQKSGEQDRQHAIEQLKRSVPDVVVDFDLRRGVPQFVHSNSSYLTPPAPGRNPHEVVRDFVRANRALFRFDTSVLDASERSRDYTNAKNGMHTLVYAQQVRGIPVYGAVFLASVSKDGALINAGTEYVPDADQMAQGEAQLDAQQALNAALTDLSLQPTASRTRIEDERDPGRKQWLTSPATLGESRAALTWLPQSQTDLRLGWDIIFTDAKSHEMYRTVVDAGNGRVLQKECLTRSFISKELSQKLARARTQPQLDTVMLLTPHDSPSVLMRKLSAPAMPVSAGTQPVTYNVWTSDSPTPMSPGFPTTSGNTEPPLVNRAPTTLTSLDATASPNGWIDDGNNTTLGNNVAAYADPNAINTGTPVTGTGNRVFNFTIDLTQDPSTYRNGAVAQLFYWCNFMHDKLYDLGFTESAGNFQTDNFGRGGQGNDCVLAEAQDGSGTDNANFSPPVDGMNGRMQMYLWDGTTPNRDGDLDATVILHEYTHGLSNRLVGGGVLISALQTAGMGEGWSDFYALCMLSQATDDVDGTYQVGSYVFKGFTSLPYYYGIRHYPYCREPGPKVTSSSKNPYTLANVNGLSEVHNIGEIWCMALWEVRANLVDKYAGSGTDANQLMLQLVTDGMKLSPANPNFLQARDAILQADIVDNNGANIKQLWNGFAKRGMGVSATSPDSSSTSGLVAAFDVPGDLYILPASNYVAGGYPAGPFSPASMKYTFQNIGVNSLNWTAARTQDWLTISPASGTLMPNASVDITVSLNSNANALAEGEYLDTLTFTNSTSGSGNATRGVSLTVAKNYQMKAATFSWIDPTTHTSLSLADDDGSAAQTLPFSFKYYGKTYTSLYVSSNGFVTFTNSDVGEYQNSDLPNPAAPNNVIAPYWMDLYPPQSGAAVKIGNLGNAPNRQVVVSWVNVPMIFQGNIVQPVTFQLILKETTNDIVFQYKEVQAGAANVGAGKIATVGIESDLGAIARKYSYKGSAALANSQAILFTQYQPPTVQFASAAFSTSESAGSAKINVTLNAASEANVIVNYATSDGSGIAGTDYTSANGKLTFSPGTKSQTFTVTPINSGQFGPDKTINLALSVPTNASLGNPVSAVLTIHNDNPNRPPQFTSAASAMPNPVTAGSATTLAATASNAASYAWDFGDGATGSGSSISHTYSSAGTFTAKVTATNPSGSATSSIVVTVNPATNPGGDGGGGALPNDPNGLDGNGFPNVLKPVLGMDINQPASAPFAGKPLPLTLSKMSVKLSFTHTNADSIRVSGKLDIPAGYAPGGQQVTVAIGTVVAQFPLDGKGRGKNGNGQFGMKLKTRKKVVEAASSAFQISLPKGSFASALLASGFVNDSVKNAHVSVPVTLLFNNEFLQTFQPQTYSATKNKSGLSK